MIDATILLRHKVDRQLLAANLELKQDYQNV